MIILDTNVISAVMQQRPPKSVVTWLDQQPAESVWTTSITVFEIEYGIRRLAVGKRRTQLEEAFAVLLSEDLDSRVLSFGQEAGSAAGAIAAKLDAQGKPIEVRDIQIASIAEVRNAVVATRNVKHFALMCRVVDPWDVAI